MSSFTLSEHTYLSQIISDMKYNTGKQERLGLKQSSDLCKQELIHSLIYHGYESHDTKFTRVL